MILTCPANILQNKALSSVCKSTSHIKQVILKAQSAVGGKIQWQKTAFKICLKSVLVTVALPCI